MKLVPIVEGHGEVQSVPILLRRIAGVRASWPEIGRVIRIPRGKLVKQDELKRAVQFAAKQTDAPADAICVLLDADQDCPAELGVRLLDWARAERSDRRLSVVVAKQEFEAWFLGAVPSLVAAGKLPPGSVHPADPEMVRDPKGWLSAAIGRRYSETLDQPAFAAVFDLDDARRCSSFDKFVRDVERLLTPA